MIGKRLGRGALVVLEVIVGKGLVRLVGRVLFHRLLWGRLVGLMLWGWLLVGWLGSWVGFRLEGSGLVGLLDFRRLR